MADYSYMEVERAFIAALYDAGIAPSNSERIILDGEKHRYRTIDDKAGEKSGEYRVYMDAFPCGYYKSYRGNVYNPWQYKNNNLDLSVEEREAWLEQKRIDHEERQKVKAITTAKAIQIAKNTWEAATPALPLHSYLMKKKLGCPHGARQLENDLVICYQNATGDMQTIQKIYTDGGKWFQPNAPKMGNFLLLDNKTDPQPELEYMETTGVTWICEGWATGCSIREATNDRVIVSADAGNLEPVLQNVREAFPSWDFVIAADNDRYKMKGNTGMSKAIKILNKYGIPYVAPDFNDHEKLSDWNDFACTRGLKKTREVMLRKLASVKQTPEYKLAASYPRWLDVDEKTGKPIGTQENFEILMKFLGYSIKYDEIKKEMDVTIPGTNFCMDNALNAAIDGPITSACKRYGFPVSLMLGYVNWLCSKNIINPVQDWILSEKWDGYSRVGTLCASIEPEDGFPTALRDILIRRWLVSGVAAAFKGDGFRARGTLVLQGAQAIGKTTFFKVLSGSDKWFAEGVCLDPSDKDSVKKCISNWIIELGELEATFKKADLARLKSFLTSSKDELRLPWAKKISPYQRRCVFCATVNDYQFLIDRTGNSRWWIIPIKKLHRIEGLDIQQLWAEVYESYYLSEDEERRQWWLTAVEEVMLDNSNKPFEVQNYVESLINEGLDWDMPKEYWVEMTTLQVLESCGIDKDKQSNFVAKAGQFLKKKTGSAATRKGKSGSRVYLVPPKALSYTYQH